MYELVKNLTNGLCTVVFLSSVHMLAPVKPRRLEIGKILIREPVADDC